ncbi:MAG: NADPH-dependent assimilatory sulfite reductase hemoprotein subunit [Pirellulales bacterium]|jgi:sulfite reductase (ferredoxin)|nr:NADPH-dependent assimilatory sulfite reductase hemoprotein subunit [Pirellulales bacterium]
MADTPEQSVAPAPKPSAVEGFKETSNFLAGDIAQELADGTSGFGKGSVQLLKNHGTYQQDNRETRKKSADGKKSEKQISFMVRSRIPGGKLTASQMLTQIDLGDELGNGTCRLTTRQAIQHHGIVKGDLQATIRRINEIQLTTLAACGDVERNVMCCPAPIRNNPVREEMMAMAEKLAEHLAPRTTAYHEIWLTDDETGEKTLAGGGANGHEVEPIYGPTYLPRKFKTAFALPEDNCTDVYANDLGFLTVHEDGKVLGYNVLAGGGMGVTPSAAKTFPALAKRLGFVPPEDVLEIAVAIVKVQRDFGNRSDRKVARLKYTINNMGLEAFRAKVEEYFGKPLAPCHAADVHGFDDHIGWFEQGDGKFFYGLNVENGRIHDQDGFRLKTAIRQILRELSPGVRITAHQSLLFTDLNAADRVRIADILHDHGVKTSEEISTLRRWSMACVALPTCGLAVAESERVLPGLIDSLEPEVAKLGLSEDAFTVRMTGCPNACARPYNSDIGLVGRTKGKYTIFLGGRLLGDRLNEQYKDVVPFEDLVSEITAVLACYKAERSAEETLGDFCHRKGVDGVRTWADEWLAGSRGHG